MSGAVEKLLAEGAPANSCNADGLTALHQCCIENNLKTASILVQAGADINQRVRGFRDALLCKSMPDLGCSPLTRGGGMAHGCNRTMTGGRRYTLPQPAVTGVSSTSS